MKTVSYLILTVKIPGTVLMPNMFLGCVLHVFGKLKLDAESANIQREYDDVRTLHMYTLKAVLYGGILKFGGTHNLDNTTFTVGALWCSGSAGSRSRLVIRGSWANGGCRVVARGFDDPTRCVCPLTRHFIHNSLSRPINGYPAGISSFKCTVRH